MTGPAPTAGDSVERLRAAMTEHFGDVETPVDQLADVLQRLVIAIMQEPDRRKRREYKREAARLIHSL